MAAEMEYREKRQTNELVLPSGEYAYTRDTTSGVTYVRPGPTVVNAQAQDEPVIYDTETGRFIPVSLREAAQINTVVPTGHYAVLYNPDPNGKRPEAGSKGVANDLLIGQRVHIPGPTTFALWPRQQAKVIEGHQLRSNQYLIVRVYDEQAAKENWAKAVVKRATATSTTTEDKKVKAEADVPTVIATADDVPEDLSVGRLLVIRGTEVSFYIPPTGIEVVPDDGGNYVREALTLERLQYCILIDESGEKRYVRGPMVVFPLPTEKFHTNNKGDRHFRPVELNGKIQGIHVKVISGYTDKDGDHGKKGQSYQEGAELFITGETTPIYFPCEQHSAIKYDGKTKHFATAVPAGDGRYVMARHSGAIKKVEGGATGRVYLPDPREEVFVRRVLTEAECANMYPGNEEVRIYNDALRELQLRGPATRKGVVTAGEVKRSAKMKRLSVADTEFADSSTYGQALAEMGGDEFVRAASYTEPRQVTLGNNKFAGVPKINPWTGYAVMVTDTAGNRRVEVGPKRVLLGFNETLEALSLSTGKPKTTDRLLRTAYLQTNHNKVTDLISAETSDHVKVNIKAAFRVNFEAATEEEKVKWFNVSNYVKLLSDHVRSVLKAAIRSVSVEEFFRRSEDFIRDTILGTKPKEGGRSGMFFSENNMRIYDVEVLMVAIGDDEIQHLLRQAQHEAVRTSVELAQEQRRLDAQKRREAIKQEEAQAKAETADLNAKLEVDNITRSLTTALERVNANIAKEARELDLQKEKDNVALAATNAAVDREKLVNGARLEAQRAQEELRLEGLAKEAKARIDQLKAVDSGFSEALLALNNQETLARVAEAMSVQQFVGGRDLVEVMQKAFAGTPLAGLMTKVANGTALPNGASSNRGRKSTGAQA